LDEVTIALVGKYVELKDSYKSIAEAFIHAGAETETKVNLLWIKAEDLVSEENLNQLLAKAQGILVAPGFGERGIEGKINAVRYARENNIPFFGICLGMQCAVVEFARNVLVMKGSASFEMDPETPYPVINLMENQKNLENMGGTMRLGAYPCELKKGSKAYSAYGKTQISERHRHRYEFNNLYKDQFEAAGMMTTGLNPEANLVEIVELKNHPYFIGVQFHPELKSTVLNPHPLFVRFVKAVLEVKKKQVFDMVV
ncbi:MAG TPA: CTP synthase, partial [Catalimonadaceae bacterium]|nr:CTP synthase [Catalimonadaceae bacterium]